MGLFDAALLASTIGLTVPILLASVGELISERAGVLNVGLEGMILAGAFGAYWATWETGNLLIGLLAGIAAGWSLGLIMGLLAVRLGADQIVSGVGINILAIGATTFAFDEIFGDREQIALARIDALPIPGLSDLGGVGAAIFQQDPLTYIALLSVPASWYLLYRTRWGLSIRGAGELPAAVDAAGVNVARVRWLAILAAAGFAGLAGAYLSIVEVGIFRQEMSAGRGFLALTAVIFGRWRPGGVLAACLLFGAADALQLRLQAEGSVPPEVWGVVAAAAAVAVCFLLLRRRTPAFTSTRLAVALSLALAASALLAANPFVSLPYQVWLALPFLLALVALASTVGRARMPKALTLAYHRGGA